MTVVVTEEMVQAFQRDGVVLIKGLWADWVEPLRAGIARNMAEPGPASYTHLDVYKRQSPVRPRAERASR